MNSVERILDELQVLARKIKQEQLEKVADLLKEARNRTIFVAGAGRSGCVVSAFANRLLHLGFRVCRIGEITTIPMRENDVLIVLSGSGRTSTLIPLVANAKDLGGHIVLITMDPQSEMGKMADQLIVLSGTTRLFDESDFHSVQPIGSCFEQLAWLTCDALVLLYQKQNKIENEIMLERHANLE